MKRDLTPDEARDIEIRERTERHYDAALAALVSGHPQTVANVTDSLSHVTCDDEVMGRLIVLAVTDARQAGEYLAKLIHVVLRHDAEVAAVKEVEQIEANRPEVEAEHRIDQRQFMQWAAHA